MNDPLKTIRKKIRWWLASPQERRHSLVGAMREWEKRREFQKRFMAAMGLKPEHYLLDIGCGTLRGGLPMIDLLEPGHYHGLEVREEVLGEGRKELQEAGLEHKKPRLLHAPDLGKVRLDQQFNFIWAFLVLIHMNDDVLSSCFGMVQRHLKKDGVFLANVNIGENKEGHWQGFPVVYRSQDFYQKIGAQHGLDVASLGPQEKFYKTGIRKMDAKHMLRITLKAQ